MSFEDTRAFFSDPQVLQRVKNMQKEAIEYCWAIMPVLTEVGKETAAFVQRVYDAVPLGGQVPKGTQMISGMVGSIVKATKED